MNNSKLSLKENLYSKLSVSYNLASNDICSSSWKPFVNYGHGFLHICGTPGNFLNSCCHDDKHNGIQSQTWSGDFDSRIQNVKIKTNI